MSKKSNKSGAPCGNRNGIKLKDSEIRQLAYTQYCEHLAKGKSKRSWYFKHPQLSCTWETIEKYLLDEIEFDPIHKKIAEAQGFGFWEGVVEDSAIGKNQAANTASLQMVMRNKFSWDKESGREVLVAPELTRSFEALMTQFSFAQNEYSKGVICPDKKLS